MLGKSELIASFNGITDIILIMGVDYKIVFANKAFCIFYNITNLEQIISKYCYEIIHGSKEQCKECPTEITLEGGKVVTVEKEMHGEILKYWTYPVFSSNNTIKNIVSYSRIITDQKRLEQELSDSELMKGIAQFSAGVVHELNNPLCSILGFAELIKESIDGKNTACEFINDIIDSANQSRKLVQALIDYSRP